MLQSTLHPAPAKEKRSRAPNKSVMPLFRHQNGWWAKKIKGKLRYFGRWSDDPSGDRALRLFNEQLPAILANQPLPQTGLNVAQLAFKYLQSRAVRVESGELAPRTYEVYEQAVRRLVACMEEKPGQPDTTPDVTKLTPMHFARLRVRMAQPVAIMDRKGKPTKRMTRGLGLVAMRNQITYIRQIFRWAYEMNLIEKPIKFGPDFDAPSKRRIRDQRNRERQQNGLKLFTPEGIHAALKVARPQMRAMILLGINGGLGNTDCALLTENCLDLDNGWLDFPRPKTGVPRRVPLWRETIAALREAIATRPTPNSRANPGLLFIGANGCDYVGAHKGRRVYQESDRVFIKAGIPERNFYDLRRTFQTIAERCRDLVAVKAVMGHAEGSGDMSAVYRQTVEDARLRAAVEAVHQWLFAKPSKGKAVKHG